MLRRLIYTIVICIGATSGIQAQVADFGDAPDGEPTGYPSPFAAVGSFPSLRSSDGARTLDITRMTLGPEADLEEDAQTVNNDTDDGLRGLTLVLTSIPPSAHLEVEVSAGTGGVFFLNVLIDLNMDGQWPGWGAGGEYEWVVRNFPVALSAGDSDTVVPPLFAFGNGNRMPDGAWMRVALTDSVINGSWDGSGEFAAGEIEDYVVRMPEKEGTMVSVVTATCPAPPLGDPIIIEQGDTVDFDAIVNVIPGPDNISYSFERLIGGVLIQDNNPGAVPGFKDAFQGVLLNQAGPGNRAGFTAKAAGVLPSTWRYRFWAEDPLTSVFDTHVIVGFPDVVEGNIEFVQTMFETSVIGAPSCTVNGDGRITINDISQDIWNQQDSGFLYGAQIPGDVTIEVKVDSLENTDYWAKTGLTCRDSLEPGAPNVAIVATPSGIAQLQWRLVTDDWTQGVGTDAGTITCPYWLRLERVGNTFKGYYSVDGVNWYLLGGVNVDMPEHCHAGIVATSHTVYSMCTVELSNFEVQGSNITTNEFVKLASGSSIGYAVIGSCENDPDSGTQTLSNQGHDIWGTDDTLTYTYTLLEGDGEISARVTGIDSTDPWAKGGVMIRETLDPGSAHAFIAVAGGNFTAFQHRKVTGGHSNSAHGYLGTAAPPYYVKVVREGDTFTGYYSADGSTWFKQCNSNLYPDIYAANPTTISMGRIVYVGTAYSANDPLHISKAYFDNVKLVSKDNDTAAHAVVIDNFMVPIDFLHVNDGSSMPTTAGTTVVGDPSQVLGEGLDIMSTLFNANPYEGVKIQCQECFKCQVDENADARVSMTWDGLDNDWLNDNVSQDEGLGTSIVRPDMNYTISIDVVENSSPVDIEIYLYSDDTDWTRWIMTIPVVSDPCQMSLLPEGAIFSGTGANPNCISAIKFVLGAGENVMQGPMDITINRLDVWNFLLPSDRFMILDYMGISPQEPVPLEIGGVQEGHVEGLSAPVKPDVDLREYVILNADLTSGEEIVQQSLATDLDTQANATSMEDLDMLFPCGDGPVGFTICASSSPFSSGQYVLLVTKFVGDIPLQHGGQIYEYSVVFDSDGETWNNYIPEPAYSNDFFAYTDKWYKLTYVPTDGWNLQVRDVRQNYAVVSSNARVVIAGSEMAWLIPREELDSDTAGWRTTALVHTGDYGFTGGFWSMDYYPLVDDPLIPIPGAD